MFDKNIKLFNLNEQRIVQFKKYIFSSEDINDKDMVPSIPLLEKMNNLWFFTLDSQGGNINKFEQDGIKYTVEERSYVTGFIPNVIYKPFEKQLLSCSNIFLKKMDINIVEDEVDLTRIKEEKEDGTIENSIQTSLPNTISQEQINDFLDMFHYVEPSAYGGGVDGLILNPDEWTGVIIVDKRWNYASTAENSAFRCIINALNTAIKKPKKGGKSRKQRR